MPILRVGIRQGKDVLYDLGKRIATRRCPKADSSGGKLQEFYQYQNEDRKDAYIYIICKVEPCVWGEGCAPFLNSTDHPYKICGRGTNTVF